MTGAVLLSALVFGLLHLPAAKLLTPITRVVIVRTLVLNGVVGLVAGWIYIEMGLLAAMATHWAADVVILLIASPLIARSQSTLVDSPTSVDGSGT
jgi:membrane protease YdiL (CAAX protease family)